MKFLERIFSPAQETKKSRGYALHFSRLGAPSWSKKNYSAYSTEGYAANVIVHSAVNRVARAISSIEWVVYENGEKLTEHPLLDLIERPNTMQTRSQWWEQKIGYLLLDGNTFEELVTVRGMPRELWNLRPDRMEVVPGPNGIPSKYVYSVNQRKLDFPVNANGLSPIRHLRLFHPLDDWRGLSPIAAGAFAIDQHNESMTWIQSLLQNSARPSGDEFKRLQAEIEAQHSGGRNAGRPMLLEGGLDWKSMGLSPVDMEILRVREMSARDISLAFGVPPLLLNIPGDNTYANYREARLGFYEDTVLPLLDYLVQDFNFWIASRYYPTARLSPNYDSIEAIAEKRMKMWAMADASDDITLNESRAMKGLPPMPDPLGSTLMSEIRSGSRGDSPTPAEDKSIFDSLQEAVYGPRS